MIERVAEEVEFLRSAYPDLEYRAHGDQHWIRIPRYSVPAGWSQDEVEVAFQIPSQAGKQPYAFWVRPQLALSTGSIPTNYTSPAATPWGADWAQFSWSPVGQWVPKADIRAGANMLNFARSFADRLQELS